MTKPHYHHQKRTAGSGFFLSFIDGLEGGFAIFAGIVVGLSFTDLPRDVLIVTAIVGIVVNAVNAATIRYTTENYLDEYLQSSGKIAPGATQFTRIPRGASALAKPFTNISTPAFDVQ